MSIKFISGDMFKAETQAIVNTVNCVGVMGKGVALEFKKRWPKNYKEYKKRCSLQQIVIGQMFIYDTQNDLFNSNTGFRYLINFPTKKHWRSKSKIEYITEGMDDLVEQVKKLDIKSVAIPPLGCGNGGLSWLDVKPIIADKISELPYVDWLIYEPIERAYVAPEFENIPHEMTVPRALLVKVLGDFASYFGGSYTRLTIQKLVYFMQALNVDFNLTFTKEKFGPYSKELHNALQGMENKKFLTGYNSDTEIGVTSAAYAAAEEYLAEQSDNFAHKIKKLSHLVDGFESPFGMEILSSIHYLYHNDDLTSLDNLVIGIQNWNKEKSEKFTRSHISVATQRLIDDELVHIN